MDLIERSALLKDLDDLKKSPWYNTGNPFIQQGMRECMDMIETQCIKKALAVDAKPVRHGKWIYSNDFYWYTASCNKCGYQRRTDIKAGGWNQWKFCPNCGAKMDGEDEQPSSEDCDQIFEFVMERLKAEKTLERLGQILGEVFGKIDETIDDCCNEFLKEKRKQG